MDEIKFVNSKYSFLPKLLKKKKKKGKQPFN